MLTLAAGGCAATHFADPIAAVSNRQLETAHRIAAVEQVQFVAPGPQQDRAVAALSGIVWSSHEPLTLRQAAARRLVVHDAVAFQAQAASRLMQVQRWPMLQFLFHLAKVHHWMSFADPAIRSWARPSNTYPDNQRPERALLMSLYPGQSVKRTLARAFRGEPLYGDAQKPYGDVLPHNDTEPTPSDALRVQATAWTVLCRIMTRAQRRAMLAATTVNSTGTSASPLVADLKAASHVLDILPHNRETILWLLYDLDSGQSIGHPSENSGDESGEGGLWKADGFPRQAGGYMPEILRGRSMWNAAVKIAPSLTVAQRQGLSIRHLAALVHSSPWIRTQSPQALYMYTLARVESHQHQTRTSGDKTNDLYPSPLQTLASHRAVLCWADLVQINQMLDAMRSPAFVATVFTQADADRKDKTTEHGGVLTWRDGHIVTEAFAPAMRAGDWQFVASRMLIQHLYTGLAHYHFHAQHYDNAPWAGPGHGDLVFADRFHTAAVVFTFTNADTINVDEYQPGDVVVDLGMIHRRANKKSSHR